METDNHAWWSEALHLTTGRPFVFASKLLKKRGGREKWVTSTIFFFGCVFRRCQVYTKLLAICLTWVAYGAFQVCHTQQKIVVKLNERRMGMGKKKLFYIRFGREREKCFSRTRTFPRFFFLFCLLYIWNKWTQNGALIHCVSGW